MTIKFCDIIVLGSSCQSATQTYHKHSKVFYFRRDVTLCYKNIQQSKYRSGTVTSLLLTLTIMWPVFSPILSEIP